MKRGNKNYFISCSPYPYQINSLSNKSINLLLSSCESYGKSSRQHGRYWCGVLVYVKFSTTAENGEKYKDTKIITLKLNPSKDKWLSVAIYESAEQHATFFLKLVVINNQLIFTVIFAKTTIRQNYG